MDDRQERRHGSHRTTAQVLTDNARIFAAVPAMVTEHQNLIDSIALADALACAQGTNTKGVTEAKREFLRQMKMFTIRVAGALKYYASVNNDLTLAAKAKVVGSDFTKPRDELKDDVAQRIYDAALPLVGRLGNAGITEETLPAFLTRIEAYKLAVAGPEVARKTRRNFTELLDAEIRRADMICNDRLDGLMEQFRFEADDKTQTSFYNLYQAARETIDTGHRKQTLPSTPLVPANA